MTQYYRICCEICNYNKVIDGTNHKLVPYKRANIQGNLPILNPDTNKLETKPSIKLPKKFKCPQCGRLVSPRPLKETPIEDKTKNDNEQNLDSGGKGGFERW